MAFVEYEKQWGSGRNCIKVGEVSIGRAGSIGFANEDLDAVNIKKTATIYIDSDALKIAFGPGETWAVQNPGTTSRFLQCKSGLKFLGWTGQHGRVQLVREKGRLVADLTELLMDCFVDVEESTTVP